MAHPPASCVEARRGQARRACPRGCFPGGTLVQTPDGPVPIERVTPGMPLVSYDIVAARWQFQRVLRATERIFSGELYRISVGTDTIDMTWDQPLWVMAGRDLELRRPARTVSYGDRGNTHSGQWVLTADLEAYDRLMSLVKGELPVGQIERRRTEATVYGLEVALCHTYAVGALGVLVHNIAHPARGAPHQAISRELLPQPQLLDDELELLEEFFL